MIGYSTLYKSMNGIKVLSDGVSVISDGQAQHDDIIYNDFIYSQDGKTQLTNNKVKTEQVECLDFQADDITSLSVNTDSLQTKYFLVNYNNVDYFKIDPITNNKLTSNIEMDFNEQLNIINKDIRQVQTGRIYQQGTNNNYLKDTYINGYLQIGSNLTQLGGSSSLKDLTIDNLSLRENKSITQTGANVSNTLAGTTTTKDLVILNSVVFPSSVTVPGTTTTDDIVMEGNSVIVQDLTTATTKKNIFRNTKTLDLEIDGNLSQIKGGATAILKNTTIQGTVEIQGDITQTTGTTILKTLRCNNITLNDDQIITMSGIGYITQSGTGQNILKEISLLSNANLILNGSGIISQPLNGINILSHFRSAGFGIIGGRNNTTYTNYQNIQNNNGLQLQFNRDNSNQYSFIMNNRGTGGNGGFRFQRYIGGVYLDEPLVIDDNITMNKNLSIPAGSISCSSATIGNISQSELNCLDNCAQNINTKFTSLDSQISALQATTGGVSTATTGISYTSATDITLIDNNLTISGGKALLVGTTNIINSLNTLNNTLSGFNYDFTQDLNYIDNNMTIASNKQLIVNNLNVGTSINNINTTLSGITYTSGTDTTNIDNNVQITSGKKLYIGTMDIESEINALETSFTTGTINTTDLTTNNLYVNYAAKFGQLGATTYIKNDLRFCNVTNRSEGEFTQMYQGGNTFEILNHQPSGNIAIEIRNSNNTALVQCVNLSTTSFNVKNTNVDIDTNLNVDGATTLNTLSVSGITNLNGATNINNTLTLNNQSVVTGGFTSYTNPNPTNINQNKNTGTILVSGSGIFTTLVFSLTFSGSEKKKISIVSPLSYARSSVIGTQGINFSNRITSTITQITIDVKKNGIIISTFAPQFSENFTKTIRATKQVSSTGFTYTYEIFFGYISFTYEIDSYTSDTYEFYANTYLTNTFENETPIYSYVYANTNITSYIYNQYIASAEFASSNYSSPSYQLLIPSYKSETGLLLTNDIVSNNIYNQYNISSNTASINSASINNITNFVKMKSNIAGYLFNGSTQLAITPIICSMKGIVPDNGDDYYVLNPGFKFELYRDLNYSGPMQEISNDNNNPEVKTVTNKNLTSSIKVFYRNNPSEGWIEISYSGISY